MKHIKGKLADYEASHKGYISGAFFPNELLNYDHRVEISFKKLPPDYSLPRHFHKHAKTWVIVLKGKMYFVVDEQPVEVGEGEFLIFERDTAEEITKVEPGTECISIHAPSVVGGDRYV